MQVVQAYLEKQGPAPGPLFKPASGMPLSRAALVDHLHKALQRSGLEASSYNGHSFRIVDATTAAKCRIATIGRVQLTWRILRFLANSLLLLHHNQCRIVDDVHI